MTLPRVLTQPIGGSKLSLAMQRGEVAGSSPPWPQSAEAWRAAGNAVRERFSDGAWLKQLAPAFGSTANIPALVRAAGSGIVVTTGQQPGLFGGHMLTLVKALSARALADSLERATGIPCATVFWAATDDADFVEAASVKVPSTGAAKTLSLTVAPPAGASMAHAPLVDIGPLLETMRSCCGSSGDATMAMLRSAYHEGATVGSAYVALMREVLGPLGIAVLDASHPAVTGAARALLRRALANAAEVERRMVDWTAFLERSGWKPQVAPVPGLSLVFANEGGIKRRIPIAEADWVGARAINLSSTVLLRPVVEAAILPTVAYAGGPGELAYFAQVGPIADALGARRPIAVPRWSTTIVERGVDRILGRYGVTIDALRDYDTLLTRLVAARTPPDIAIPMRDLRANIDWSLAQLAAGAHRQGIDDKIVSGIQAQLKLRVDRGERRITAALKRNEVDLQRDLGTARASLYPDGKRQERELSFIPYLARYGRPLIDRMLQAAAIHADRLTGASSAAAKPT